MLTANANKEIITNGDFEEASNIATTDYNVEGPADTWWRKRNTDANPTPQCSLSIVTPGHE